MKIGARNQPRPRALSLSKALLCCLFCLALSRAAPEHTAAGLAQGLTQVKLDPDQSFRVRELQLTRGDVKIYLTEGILSFLTPVGGRRVAAVFTTEGVEAGDGEVVVLPPGRSERTSLNSFTDSPNLDEHISFALLVFSDDTLNELMAQIGQRPVHKATEVGGQISDKVLPIAHSILSDIDARVIQGLLDRHSAARGFLFEAFVGTKLGAFEALYDPADFEPVSVGRLAALKGQPVYQLWTAFRPRRAPAYIAAHPAVSDYRIQTEIRPDLSMSVAARFSYRASPEDGRAISLSLSNRLQVSTANIDGEPAEVFEHDTARSAEVKRAGTFLLTSANPLAPGEHQIEVHYAGSVIQRTASGDYFVDDRNLWYPYITPVSAHFDLTFRCPAKLRLVSTGELISDEVDNGVRTVHRKTNTPVRLAGFNLGDYSLTSGSSGKYQIECYANRSHDAPKDLSKETQQILDGFSKLWRDLPLHNIAVTPTPGYFGQGFPGLIYLADASYLPPEDRPAFLRSPWQDSFFSQLLLPHEIAHQWWGNVVTAADYRSMWLMEAMANYSALQFLEQNSGAEALNSVLALYRDNLKPPVESAGPVDFGTRLMQTAGLRTWEVIVYEKGSWVMHMLRQRLGDAGFVALQRRLLRDFSDRPITNEDLRRSAADFVPKGQADKDLSLFFDTWVYGTGVPRLTWRGHGEETAIEVAGVPDDFTVDVPLRCGKDLSWMRVNTGSNPVPAKNRACRLDYASVLNQ